MAGKAKRKQQRAEPGYEGRMELVHDQVESPYDSAQRDVVVRNIRESSLATMFARRQIDEAQLMAGQRFRALYERASSRGSMAVDPSKEPVDTSGISDPIPDRVITAARELHSVRAELGRIGYGLVSMVCGQGLTIDQVAKRMYVAAHEGDRMFVGKLFREHLDVLAASWGLAGAKRSWRSV